MTGLDPGGSAALGGPPRPTWRDRALRLAASESARGPATSFGLKVGGSALNILMLSLVARTSGAHEFGLFALWFNAVSFGAVVAGCGQEKLILRSWSEYVAARDWSRTRGALQFGIAVSLAGALVMALAATAAGWTMGAQPALFAAAALYLALATLYLFSAHVNRAMIGILSGDVHDMTWRVVIVIGAGLALLFHREMSAAQVFVLASLGAALSLLLQTATGWRHLPAAIRAAVPVIEAGAWLRRSLHMAAGGMLEGASQFLEVIAVGLVLSPAAAGGYFVASRLANVFSMITSGFNSYATRQISRQHYGSERAALVRTLRGLAAVTAGLVACVAFPILIFGHEILALFGPAFRDQYPTLLLLSAGTGFVALMGPAAAILLFTGHERTYSILIGLGVVTRLGMLLALAAAFGSTGAAAASAGGGVALAVALNLACRRLAGVDPSPFALLPARARS